MKTTSVLPLISLAAVPLLIGAAPVGGPGAPPTTRPDPRPGPTATARPAPGPTVRPAPTATILPVPPRPIPTRPGTTGYRARDLGTLGGAQAHAQAVNDQGVVVGWSTTRAGTTHAFQWSGGRMVDLTPRLRRNSYASDVNATGQIAGWTTDAQGVDHPALWTNGRLTTLPAVRGEAFGLNDRGDVVGSAVLSGGGRAQAVLWRAGRAIPLSRLGATGADQAQDINNSGQVIGSDRQGAFLLTGRTVRHYVTDAYQVDRLNGLNSAGVLAAAGDTSPRTHVQHALLINGSRVRNLGSLDTGPMAYSAAYGVNDQQIVVGVTSVPGSLHAFVWRDGRMTDLGVLGASTMNGSEARAVNAAGTVVGSSAVSQTDVHAVMWTPARTLTR